MAAWVLLVVAIVPGMALAIWNAARGRRLGTPTGRDPQVRVLRTRRQA